MKVNESPKKIYISNFDIEALPKNEQLSERWHEVSTQDTDIEYTRTDAFIEKACSWLSNMPLEDMEYKYDDFDTSEGWYKMIEDFKKYMEK